MRAGDFELFAATWAWALGLVVLVAGWDRWLWIGCMSVCLVMLRLHWLRRR